MTQNSAVSGGREGLQRLQMLSCLKTISENSEKLVEFLKVREKGYFDDPALRDMG